MNKSESHVRIAKERIDKLFLLAENSFANNPTLSDRYVALSRRIAMKYNIRFSKDKKYQFCKNCSSYLKKGRNSTIRIRMGRIILRCLNCGHVRRFRL